MAILAHGSLSPCAQVIPGKRGFCQRSGLQVCELDWVQIQSRFLDCLKGLNFFAI